MNLVLRMEEKKNKKICVYHRIVGIRFTVRSVSRIKNQREKKDEQSTKIKINCFDEHFFVSQR